MSGADVGKRRTRTKLCAGCEGWLRPIDQQCPSCGRMDTINFDSMAEAKRFGELRLLEKAGQITELKLQPRYELRANGGRKIGTYVADFRYLDTERGGGVVVEDVKGGGENGYVDTDLARWKRAHCQAEYGFEVQIIKR